MENTQINNKTIIVPDEVANEEFINNTHEVELAILTETLEDKAKKRKLLIFVLAVFAILVIILLVITPIYKSNQEVNDVINKINNIGTVEYTKEIKEQLESISLEFDSLNENQQNKITNHNILLQKVEEYKILEYYDNLVKACNLINSKAEAAIEIMDGMKDVWYNVNNQKSDSYNNGNYDFDTAMQAYWNSVDCRLNSIKLDDSYIDNSSDDENEGKTLSDYLTMLKSPPEQYIRHHEAFSDLYSNYEVMIALTKSVNHTYYGYVNESNTLESNYNIQHSKTRTIIPEMD